MPKLTKRKLQAIETKNRIYETGVELMELKGFENITIDEISKKAGVSVGAFYHHFKSKEDILYKLFESADEFMETKSIDTLEGTTASIKILFFFEYLAKLYIYYGIDIIKALYKTQTKLFLCTTSVRFVMLHNIVSQGIEQGEIDPSFSAEETTKFLFTGARGIAFNWCLDNGKFDLVKAMNEYIQRLLTTIVT
ncbi:transcriptional regulator, TetR family [Desulfocicer vacuolatum DSM 3385]|uniref:Transcriptional regulator, TetR family n=1 Tax=Desulfocicer vacuolatum DSM 3385 TaxID=1121400 RepID=A0A1W2BIS7_9BACT|nr:TetR/AcrR family transcriptional regulator [Desulfocicer vacuolatum]SMC72670.1 transcriptional regulator, TetR family [Desulfocicer vacuolatum DSM 3385]